jgi:hypothetical protein
VSFQNFNLYKKNWSRNECKPTISKGFLHLGIKTNTIKANQKIKLRKWFKWIRKVCSGNTCQKKTEHSAAVSNKEFTNQPSNYQFIEKNSAPKRQLSIY